MSETDGAVLKRAEYLFGDLGRLLMGAAKRDLLTSALVIHVGDPFVLGDDGVCLVNIEIDGLFLAVLSEATLLGGGKHLGNKEPA